MGIDVFGAKATTTEGEYFRNNWWWWRPLAHYCCEVAPDVTAHCKYWQSNDGDGLNAEDSVALADALQRELDSGLTEKYAEERQAWLAALPDVACDSCNGSGVTPEGRFHPAGTQCSACDGTGHTRPWDVNYRFSVENVRNFVAFLRGCGGFSIW